MSIANCGFCHQSIASPSMTFNCHHRVHKICFEKISRIFAKCPTCCDYIISVEDDQPSENNGFMNLLTGIRATTIEASSHIQINGTPSSNSTIEKIQRAIKMAGSLGAVFILGDLQDRASASKIFLY